MSSQQARLLAGTYTAGDLLFIRAITPLHVGVGRTGGVVDLPIQRDEYGYPCIYSSSIKGALKTSLLYSFVKTLEDYNEARMAVQALLGPEPEEGETFESSIAILDAYLFAMPVRSLKGVYTYITSPLLIARFHERLELLKTILQDGDQTILDKVSNLIDILGKIIERELEINEAICIGKNNECENLKVDVLQGKAVLAEEFFLDLKSLDNSNEISEGQATKPDVLVKFIRNVAELDKPLLIVNDSIAKDVIERSILRYTRVRLRRETKTVGAGPWTEEYLPPKAVLHTMTLYKKPSLSDSFIKNVLGEEKEQELSYEDRYLNALKKLQILDDDQIKNIKNTNSIVEKMRMIAKGVKKKVKNLISEQLKGYIILGGHETIGKGIVNLKLIDFEEPQNILKEESK